MSSTHSSHGGVDASRVHNSSGVLSPPTSLSDLGIQEKNTGSDARVPSQNFGDILEPIAVIGFAQKLPGGCDTAKKFWDLIVNARSALADVPADRWNLEGFYSDNPAKYGVQKSRQAHFVEQDLSRFDAPFFNITAGEATFMDPQQRWLLETAYHAFENAGLSLEDVSNSRTSVFVASFLQDYARLLEKDPQRRATFGTTGNGAAMLANRLSWFFNLKGPSITLDTACSGSLIALDLACQSIRSGETDMGIIGACNLLLSPEVFIALSDNGFLSKDGRSYSFDQRANGYSRGEGSGIVVLKRLSDAIRDGNDIRAVIRSSGSNQDGRTLGITLPNSDAQKALIKETYQKAGLSMSETGYFEAHGTGTMMGDPIEARAIAESFEGSMDRPLYIGSLKPLIGHLENASGVASLIKAILVAEKGVIPPLGFMENINEVIDKNDWPIIFPKSAMMWPTRGLRRVSINSFGYGGANCHVVLDDAFNYSRARGLTIRHRVEGLSKHQSSKPTEMANNPRLLVFSAADKEGLKRISSSLEQFLRDIKVIIKPQLLADLCFTLYQKRSQLSWRSSLVVSSSDRLNPELLSQMTRPHQTPKQFNAVFVFTGQGAQWARMGQDLISNYPVFQYSLEVSEKHLKCIGCKWSLLEELEASEDRSRVDEPEISQVLCTALQIALVDLLRHFRVEPVAVIGHSSGEIAAAYCAGAISHRSAIKLAYARGIASFMATKLISEPLGMMAIALSRKDTQELIDGEFGCSSAANVYIACVNGPKNVTLSGARDALTILHEKLEAQGTFARFLKTDMAYHSPYTESIVPIYEALIQSLEPGPSAQSKAAIFSSTKARKVSSVEILSPSFWVQNLVAPVLFSEALCQVLQDPGRTKIRKLGSNIDLGINFILEVGPHPALRSSIREILQSIKKDTRVAYSPTLQRSKTGPEAVLLAASRIHDHGSKINIMAVNNLDNCIDSLNLLTDLPAYPFNHSKQFWSEGRISKAYNRRAHRAHELLGVRDPASSSQEPKWRHNIILDDHPWIKDHHIFGVDIYPAAGLLVMALEAARQLAEPKKIVSGFLFESVTIMQALLVKPSESGTEVETSLKLLENTRGRLTTWYSFRICVFSGADSYECCTGEVGVEYENSVSEVDSATIQDMLYAQRLQTLQALKGVRQVSVNPEDFYAMIEEGGLQFGPSFRAVETLECSHESQFVATATVNTLHWQENVENSDILSHIIHPAALDAILQPGNAAISQGKKEDVPSMVPSKIPTFRISAKACHDLKNPRIKAHTSASSIGFRTTTGKVFALAEEDQVLLVDGIVEFTTLENPDSMGDPINRCYHIEWKPDISLMNIKEIEQHCIPLTPYAFRAEYRQNVPIVQMVRRQAIHHAARLLEQTIQYEKNFVHLLRYRAFLRRKLAEVSEEIQYCEDLDEYLDSVDEVASRTPEGELTIRVARNLNSFLDGSADPLTVLFEDDLMARHYADAASGEDFGLIIKNYLDLISHKNPTIKILEIGAGTGSVSRVAIDALGRNGDSKGDGPRFSQYCYTDISISFFEAAKERFADYSDRIEYKVLDIGQDPTAQGFESEAFDIIIAANVLHATPDLSVTMDNVYKLLKPNGKFILTDVMTPDSLRSSFVYGLLPGWWLSVEDERKQSPLLSPSQWHDKLLKHGFNGVEFSHANDPLEEFYLGSLLFSSKPSRDPIPGVIKSELCVIYSQESQPQQELAVKIKELVSDIGVQDCTLIDVNKEEWFVSKQQFCVFLPEFESPYLNSLSAVSLQKLKTLLKGVAGVLWVCGKADVVSDTFSGMAIGLSRSYRTENPGFKFVTLTVDRRKGIEPTSKKILRIINDTLSSADEFCEDELQEQDDLLQIGRVVQAKTVNQQIYSHSHRKAHPKPFRDGSGRRIALSIDTPGLLETLQFDDAPFAANKIPLGDSELEIDLRAAGVNFRDILIATGQYDLNCFGWESVGIVRETGSSVSDIKVGDRVACMMPGAFANVGRCYAAAAIKLPDSITDEVGASLPIIACTVLYAFLHVGQLSKGESVLIHSGAGGLGQTAIQMAQHIGAEIYTTVGSQEKKEFLHQRYKIPLDHILYSRGVSFATALKRLTNGRGVDVCLNSLGGQALRETWKCMAPLGRFLEVGKKDALTFSKLPMEPFSESVTFACIDLAVVYTEKPGLAGKLLRQVLELVQAGHLSPPDPLHIYSGSDIENAFRLLQEGKSIGKAVIKFSDDQLVSTVPSRTPEWNFNPDVSYMIIGGLGGLGQYMARWMVDRGARNLILVSRRTKLNDDDTKFLDELRNVGVSVLTPPCDVSNEESFKATVELCRREMPIIKGCIHAAMLIRDETFQRMKYADLQASVGVKVQGSLNLHTYMPRDLDFLIFLSSISSLPGWHGQSNYAIGNVFQAQLARYRTSQGLKAVCIDLGIVYDAGYISNNPKLKDNMQKIGLLGLKAQNLLSALERYCDPRLPVLSATECQPILGQESQAQVARRGGEVEGFFRRPLFACMNQLSHASGLGAGSGAKGGFNVIAALAKVKTLAEAADVLVEGLVTKLSLMFSIDKDEVATDRPLHSYGVDSLVAIEIRNWFRKSLNSDVPVLEILGNGSIVELAAIAANRSALLAPLRTKDSS